MFFKKLFKSTTKYQIWAAYLIYKMYTRKNKLSTIYVHVLGIFFGKRCCISLKSHHKYALECTWRHFCYCNIICCIYYMYMFLCINKLYWLHMSLRRARRLLHYFFSWTDINLSKCKMTHFRGKWRRYSHAWKLTLLWL